MKTENKRKLINAVIFIFMFLIILIVVLAVINAEISNQLEIILKNEAVVNESVYVFGVKFINFNTELLNDGSFVITQTKSNYYNFLPVLISLTIALISLALYKFISRRKPYEKANRS